MRLELWRRAEGLFHAALERSPEDRQRFLDEACGEDAELRQQVEILISKDEHAGSFLEEPLLADTFSLSAGTMIGRYRVEQELGHGGMGTVYRAFDTQLRRDVPLKVLPPEHHEDPRWQHHLLHEARAASALNHPNIITVHEIGSDAGVDFIAMELVEGKPLRQIIPPGGLPPSEALGYAEQMADALAKAHARGVTHRDLKPGNIMVTSDGLVKVLDFGLARRVATGEAATSSTLTPGVAGTPSYMSPEQARGEELDARTDLFSFGAVLYEMVTGVVAFKGATTAVVFEAILDKTPIPAARLSRAVPLELERIITKALEKNREARYQSAADLLADLHRLKRDPNSAPPAAVIAALRNRVSRPLWAAIAAALLLAALLVYLFTGRGQTIHALAVLPMVNANADTSTEYLSDGITESLINSLSQLPKLRVMSRSSVFRYKMREADPQMVGRELKVEAVLTGRVVQHGDTLSISAELVNARDNTHIWGEQYNRRLADIQAVQEDIGREITDTLRLKLTGEQKKSLTRRLTQNSEAYQDYLKGRYYWNQRTVAGLKTAIEYFNAAVAKDPGFALAYAGLADCWAVLSTFAAVPARECFPSARTAALKAIEIDETIGEAHAVLAEVKALYDLDWTGAEKGFKRAIGLNPSYATAHQWYGLYLARLGRFNEAFVEMKKAQELDPLSLMIDSLVGWVFLQARRYDDAIEQLRQTLAVDPSFAYAHCVLGRTYVEKRMYREAIAEFHAGPETEQSLWCVATLGHAYAVSGRQAEAQKILDELLARSKRGYFPSWTIATIYIGLGDKDRAFEWLGKAIEERGENTVWLKVAPVYDPLRSDPRFADLLRRLNLQ